MKALKAFIKSFEAPKNVKKKKKKITEGLRELSDLINSLFPLKLSKNMVL